MKKIFSRTLRFVLLVGMVFLVYVAGVLVQGTLTDYQGPEKEDAFTLPAPSNDTPADSIFSFLIWNIGYGALGEESDFFYDAGRVLHSGDKMVRAPLNWVEKNEAGIRQIIRANPADFVLLQEVDRQSKRSYFHDQFVQLREAAKNHFGWFAVNYEVARVPLPLLEPWQVYGKVSSGLASYAAYTASEAYRLQLPGNFPWPTRIFQLDRCLLVTRFPLPNGKELVVMNVHHSAYDKGGVMKKAEMALAEAKRNNDEAAAVAKKEADEETAAKGRLLRIVGATQRAAMVRQGFKQAWRPTEMQAKCIVPVNVRLPPPAG
ncbi:MAG: hypothetical protein NWR67_06790, partial [Saprospiraceae bacterium]|nr:hypothetical protein [Saprospiraceae bacterium]